MKSRKSYCGQNPRMEDSPQPVTKRAPRTQTDIWTAQCGECFKWRVIPTQEEYEEIRARFLEDPFVCRKKPNTSCDDPADIEYDNSQTWVIDKPNLPKSPQGFKRKITLRKDSRIDCTYHAPNGKPIRSPNELTKFLDENTEYAKGISASDFSFVRPKLMVDTLPSKWSRKLSYVEKE